MIFKNPSHRIRELLTADGVKSFLGQPGPYGGAKERFAGGGHTFEENAILREFAIKLHDNCKMPDELLMVGRGGGDVVVAGSGGGQCEFNWIFHFCSAVI